MRVGITPVFVVICLFAIAPVAKAEASEGKAVKISGGIREYSAFLFEPNTQGPFPALIEIHGIDGVREFDKQVSQKLAAAGYVTLEIDLRRSAGAGLPKMDFICVARASPASNGVICWLPRSISAA